MNKFFPLSFALGLGMSASAFAANLGPLVTTEELQQAAKNNLVILDIRSLTGSKEKPQNPYDDGHINGAISAPYPKGWRVEREGIPGMLPTVPALEAFLSELGVNNDNHVVLVSEGKGPTDMGAATRAYWTLKYLGHDAVSVLDGGFEAWKAKKFPATKEAVKPEIGMFSANPQPALLSSTEEVAAHQASGGMTVDGRPTSQFQGKEKNPAAARFGRILDAFNLDQSSQFQPGTAFFKPLAELKRQNAMVLDNNKPVVSYCNSGHWAANNWFVLHELLGKKNVSLYDGSMIAWSRNQNLAMASERTRFDDVKDWIRNLW